MKKVIPFLKKLKKNNNRDWFEKNKAGFETAKGEYEVFITEIVNGLQKFDKELGDVDAKKTIFRIYRDVRFSKDKTPYKTHFGAYINPGGKKANTPGYYIHVAPGECFAVAGVYMPEAEPLQKIRQEIEYHLPEFKKILGEKKFKKNFKELYSGEAMKNPPRGFDKDSPAMPFLKNKSYIVEHYFSESDLDKNNFSKKLTAILETALPFNKFLRRAMD